MRRSLKIQGLRVSREGREVVAGVSLEVGPKQVQVIMGPNGSGKSSLANALMGHPKYEVSSGSLRLDGKVITALSPDERSRTGLFLSMQYPPELPGVNVAGFLRAAANAHRSKPYGAMEFHGLLKEKMAALKIPAEFAGRGLNEGFSGGEKKRMEVLQLLLLAPKYAVLDETDSGLDVDALKIVARGIGQLRANGAGILLITHHARILKYLVPDRVHIMAAGRIIKSGDKKLAKTIEAKGYEHFVKKAK